METSCRFPPVVSLHLSTRPPRVSTVVALARILPLRQTPEGLFRFENAATASVHTVVSSKWVKFPFWVNYPTITEHLYYKNGKDKDNVEGKYILKNDINLLLQFKYSAWAPSASVDVDYDTYAATRRGVTWN